MSVTSLLPKLSVLFAVSSTLCIAAAPALSEENVSSFEYRVPAPVFSVQGGYEPRGDAVTRNQNGLLAFEFSKPKQRHVSRYKVRTMPKIDRSVMMLTSLVMSQRVKYEVEF